MTCLLLVWELKWLLADLIDTVWLICTSRWQRLMSLFNHYYFPYTLSCTCYVDRDSPSLWRSLDEHGGRFASLSPECPLCVIVRSKWGVSDKIRHSTPYIFACALTAFAKLYHDDAHACYSILILPDENAGSSWLKSIRPTTMMNS